MLQTHGVLGIFVLVGVIALATVLVSNSKGTSSVINAVTGGYSNMLKAAEGKG